MVIDIDSPRGVLHLALSLSYENYRRIFQKDRSLNKPELSSSIRGVSLSIPLRYVTSIYVNIRGFKRGD